MAAQQGLTEYILHCPAMEVSGIMSACLTQPARHCCPITAQPQLTVTVSMSVTFKPPCPCFCSCSLAKQLFGCTTFTA